jgi:dTDP-4-dehydrorhamnose 3,5-epimerase
MIFTKTGLVDVYLIDLEKREDERGFFARAWCQNEFEEHGLDSKIVQANIAFTKKKGTLRGMHYQVAPYEETKLVRCIRGAIYDLVIDLRPKSPTYKQSFGVELTPENHKMLCVPKGFAHGYLTLEDNTEVLYQVSQFYAPGAEQGIRWNDPEFKLKWPLSENLLISEKDRNWPDFTG